MTIKQILNLDCRESSNYEIVQKYLKKIKPLSKYSYNESIPFYKIEKVITVLSKKYNMRMQSIVPDVWSNDSETIWRSTVINDKTLKSICIFGLSLYEVLAKTALYMYFERERIEERRKSD